MAQDFIQIDSKPENAADVKCIEFPVFVDEDDRTKIDHGNGQDQKSEHEVINPSSLTLAIGEDEIKEKEKGPGECREVHDSTLFIPESEKVGTRTKICIISL